MKTKFKYLFLLISISFISCDSSKSNNKSKDNVAFACPMECEGDKTYLEQGSCPVCKMDLQPVQKKQENILDEDGIADNSIFNLTSSWQNHENKTLTLSELKGKTLVLVMFYTSCKSICPRLVADMKNIESQIPKNKLELLSFVMVSIDPETDNPKVLKAFAEKNQLTATHWTLLQGNKNSVQEFANILSVKYKQIAPMDFSHSNIITVIDKNGVLVHQQEGLGVNNDETIKTIKNLL